MPFLKTFIRKPVSLCILCTLLLLSGCTTTEKDKRFVIGFSQCVDSDIWRKTMLDGMNRELAFYPNVSLVYKQANGNSNLQVQQVKELIKEKVDLLIISPNEARPLTPVVEEVFNKGIPVIVVDRKTASPLYTAYIGGDNYEIGKNAGQYAANLLHNRGRILEITGLPESSPAIERRKGFIEAVASKPDIHIVQQLNGEWMKENAIRQLERLPDSSLAVDLVFAHNDVMAFGAYQFYQSKKNLPKPEIIGVDGSSSTGMQFVADHQLTATMLYPPGGEEAIQTAMKILNGETFKKNNLLQTTVLDSTNVRLMQLQAVKIGNQQTQIERQQDHLDEQQRIYKNQQGYLYVLISSLVLAVAAGGLALFSLNENRRKNKILRQQNEAITKQNEEINSQRNQLVDMSARAQAANEARVAFFTNISHEFRTPLTLILGPLEELMASPATHHTTQQSLGMIHKNVIRLLRLMNQLIDFRKLELDKMKLRASEADVVYFISEIMQSYKGIARQRKIDLRLITNERRLEMWFDTNMLDKVIFNLLSNAFKFTKDGGYVYVYLHKSNDSKQVVIKVEDNGVGISPESLGHMFEVFYMGDHENFKGSGLGLALSKELIQLHKGSIHVSSEKWKGTTFEIRLPLGKSHLTKVEMTGGEVLEPVLYEQEKVYTADLLPHKAILAEAEAMQLKEQTMLLIEDNDDLRQFLRSLFRDQYDILEAENSQSAMQQAFDNVPDIIICDVVIPGKDGMALVNIFKTDVRTSHIPVILLTAQTSVEQQIAGMKSRADAYLTKPFNAGFLKQTVQSLLSNRARLKEHFTGDISGNLKTQTVGKLDKKFISEFTAFIESHIANEDLNVEEICKSIGISRVQLYRKVKALLNINVNDYILNTRLQKARYLLQHEELSISEIAFKVGFSSPAYFSTVFKSKFGVTPTGFKEK